ncbi:hypothetical protein NDU88_002899 [Pleurodeles waltl]|uniref:Uncharacterized protein n=1 Tax=Pleurodeles waltl TaxID=8319 RepID=A0AAV7PFD0_PLEWA|nr:hypothetical protein NDU88_002899 [Pleurodeles waltl]
MHDRMGESLDCQNTRKDSMEELISDLENIAASSLKGLDKTECILKMVTIKNEDLEARSRNNIRIMGIAGSTSMGHPDAFIEQLFTDLIDHSSFSSVFAVECVHC